MASKDGTMWELQPGCDNWSEYAFIVEWTQESIISEQNTRFGYPHEDGELGTLDSASKEAMTTDAPSKDAAMNSVADPLESGDVDDEAKGVGLDEEEEEVAVPIPKRKSAAERLGNADFLFEVEDIGIFAAGATGARVNLLVADRLVVSGVEIAARDGSWGPVYLQRAEPDSPTDDVGEMATASPQPAVWIGVAVDLSFGSESRTQVAVRVRRTDWRVSPRSLALVRADDEDIGASSVDRKGLRTGPPLWSIRVPRPQQPLHFSRCSDRELVLYEMHVGSFTPEGTFKAAAAKMRHIRALGCTAISVMPIHQDARRLKTGSPDFWGYDIISFFAVDASYGTVADFVAFVEEAHRQGLAIILDYVVNHMMWGADSYMGPQYFLRDMQTTWGPRPDFAIPEVQRYALDAAELLLAGFGVDGLRIDSTKSIRKFPNDAPDAAGSAFLGKLSALCRRLGKLAIAEDLEDGDGLLQIGGLGLHMQWDMAFFCWAYDALVNPMDEHRDMARIIQGLQGLSPWRGHSLRGRVLFMESHDTATSDRYGRFGAAVHHGKAFMAPSGEDGGHEGGGDAFQKMSGSLPYPSVAAVEGNAFAARRAAIGLVLMMTAPGVPMLLQGQEVYECKPFKWPRGPALDWERVAAADGNPSLWQKLCTNLIKLRLGSEVGSARLGQSPLVGDGLHVCHTNAGIMAYLRWSEVADSRTPDEEGPAIALVAVNCTNNGFPTYELGVPPSELWIPVLSTVKGASLCSGEVADIQLGVTPGKPNHGFPCTLNVTLPPYSATIFIRRR